MFTLGRWLAAVALALAAVGLVAGLVGAGSREEIPRSIGMLVGFAAGLAVVLVLVGWPALRRRELAKRFPLALVRNIRRTKGLRRSIGISAPMRPTLVATADSVSLYGGYWQIRRLWQVPWSEVEQVELGTANEIYLHLEAIVLVLRDGSRVPLPVDQNFLPLGGKALAAIASDLGVIGSVPYAV